MAKSFFFFYIILLPVFIWLCSWKLAQNTSKRLRFVYLIPKLNGSRLASLFIAKICKQKLPLRQRLLPNVKTFPRSLILILLFIFCVNFYHAPTYLGDSQYPRGAVMSYSLLKLCISKRHVVLPGVSLCCYFDGLVKK